MNPSSTSDITQAALETPRIDTHGHWSASASDLRSAAAGMGRLDSAQSIMMARVRAEGCRRLYAIDPGVFLDPNAPDDLFQRAAALRAGGWPNAMAQAMDRARIDEQLVFTGPLPPDEDFGPLAPRIGRLAYIDPLIMGDYQAGSPDFDRAHPDFCLYDALQRLLGGEMRSLDQHLDGIDRVIASWRGRGVVGMKCAFAYTIGLSIANPSLREARTAFARKERMTRPDALTVCHYAFRHALRACVRQRLPVFFHTGFQIWGHADLRQADPMNLHNILVDPAYQDLPVVLLHGGNPYVGEAAYLAGMFPNVAVDFTWISWMSRTRFRVALADWLEVVPLDRFCWGSDSCDPETVAGIDWIVRNEIATVLEHVVRDHILDEGGALKFIENAYWRTARRLFGTSVS